jgi:hypothetical protein
VYFRGEYWRELRESGGENTIKINKGINGAKAQPERGDGALELKGIEVKTNFYHVSIEYRRKRRDNISPLT